MFFTGPCSPEQGEKVRMRGKIQLFMTTLTLTLSRQRERGQRDAKLLNFEISLSDKVDVSFYGMYMTVILSFILE
jgi:hypothetical protein